MTEVNKKDQGYIKRDLCFTKDLKVIKLLLEECIDIDGYCICGHTAVHYHAKEGNFDIVKYLLSNGADVNIKNIYGDDIYNDVLESEIYEYLINNKSK
jgi:ankyrin repeat protein